MYMILDVLATCTNLLHSHVKKPFDDNANVINVNSIGTQKFVRIISIKTPCPKIHLINIQ